jgi:hypothetical protein
MGSPRHPRPRARALRDGQACGRKKGGRREREWPGVDRATITASKPAGRDVAQGPILLGPVAGRDRATRKLALG